MNTNFGETLKPLFFMGVGALLTFIVNRYTRLDVEITNLFFDAKTQVFPLKDVAWLTAVFHDGLKYLSSALWLVLFLKMLSLIFSKKVFSGADLAKKKTVVFNYCYVLVASLLAATPAWGLCGSPC
ncbi:MAG: hypothetical protein LW629_08235 [Burkholderiales bacterium]|jgi:membrane-associated PAP2 superfamily phosphatase|nr:hypothetical protein [Burkholderiales bacterium]